MMNLVVREPGTPPLVLVRCEDCKELVARYELRGYYHHGKGMQDWLRTMPIATESTVDLQDRFARVREEAPRELERALHALEAKGKEV